MTPYRSKRGGRGYSMLELLVVIGIVSIIAAVVLIPTDNPTDQLHLESAAREVAAALRFAQSEAKRTGIPHGVDLNPGTQKLRLFNTPLPEDPNPSKSYTVYHPTEVSLYEIKFSSGRLPAQLISSVAVYHDLPSPQTFVTFFSSGMPATRKAWEALPLITAQITLTHAGRSITLNVAPQSGTVSAL